MNALFLRAAFAVLVLPGTIGFAVPLLILEPAWRSLDFSPLGWVALVPGVLLLSLCVRQFYVEGKGTLAPWSPPVHLVAAGPYRWSRNPMYVGMMLIIVGWAVGLRSPAIGWYAAFMLAAFHARILLGEEPRLAREFPDEWPRYAARTPRWIW